jgi:peptide/nickel transport system substrate-binding protein
LNATRLYEQTYEPLIYSGKDGEFIPMLAESWDFAEDGMSITFHLRKGVQFHNGFGEMKASDVVFSFKTMATYPIPTSGTDWILYDQAEAMDDYTVKLPLAKPYSLALVKLAIITRSIVSEKGWNEVGTDGLAKKDVGTGPFYLSDYLLKDHATFSRFDGYWGEKAIIETLKFRFISESSQAAVELETGGIDAMLDVAAIDYDRIDKSDTMKLVFDNSSLVDMLHFNNNDQIFKDVKVRQALAYAFNREDVFKAVYMGWGRIAYGPIAPEVWAYDNEFEGDNYPYGYDVEKSKALLAEAGYPNGFTFELCVDQDVNRQAVSQIIKNQFEKVGVTVNINNMDQATLNAKIAENSAQSWLYAVNAVTMEPDYIKAQQIWMAEVPSIPYYVRPQVYASAKNLEGIVYYGNGYLFNKAYFK